MLCFSVTLLPPQSPQQTVLARARLFCGNCDSSTDLSNDEASAKKLKASTSTEKLLDVDDSPRSKSGPELSVSATACNNYLTSTPACVPLRACPDLIFTPEDQDRKSMSPITRSTQRMTRAMQVFKTITIYCLGVRGVVAIAKKVLHIIHTVVSGFSMFSVWLVHV